MEAARTAFGEFAGPGIPHLTELPTRGPGSELLGRGALFLEELPVDLQPSGWRLVSRPGRDFERATSMLRQDLDVLAEVADGYSGPLKVQAAGPWTLAAGLYLPRLERAVVDAGACRDIVAALAEGLSNHVREIQRLIPGAQVIVQLDEPSIGAVLGGELPTASGFGRLRSVEEPVVEEGLRSVLSAVTAVGAVETLVHCCAPDAPTEMFVRAGADGVSVDVALLGVRGWEMIAPLVEAGRRLWAGAVATSAPSRSAVSVAEAVRTPWRRLGLETQLLGGVVITPACGLAGLSPQEARVAVGRAVTGATELARRAEG